jgi:hypothetical protein
MAALSAGAEENSAPPIICRLTLGNGVKCFADD